MERVANQHYWNLPCTYLLLITSYPGLLGLLIIPLWHSEIQYQPVFKSDLKLSKSSIEIPEVVFVSYRNKQTFNYKYFNSAVRIRFYDIYSCSLIDWIILPGFLKILIIVCQNDFFNKLEIIHIRNLFKIYLFGVIKFIRGSTSL